VLAHKNPITGIAGCCARATSGSFRAIGVILRWRRLLAGFSPALPRRLMSPRAVNDDGPIPAGASARRNWKGKKVTVCCVRSGSIAGRSSRAVAANGTCTGDEGARFRQTCLRCCRAKPRFNHKDPNYDTLIKNVLKFYTQNNPHG
jgi:hypothetical protein